MARIDIRRWALLGARERLTQLAAEASEIYKVFPELRSHAIAFGKRTGRPPASAAHPAPSAASKRRTMSAEGRKRISEAQKARWAKQRKEKDRTK